MSDAADPASSAGQGTTIPLFATPFAAVATGAAREFNARLADQCEAQRSVPPRAGDPPRDPLHFRSRQDFLDSPDAVAELRRLIVNHACGVVAGLNAGDTGRFGRLQVQVRGWCSILQRNGHVSAQHFPNSSWLAVYCVQAGAADPESRSAGVLRLYERRLESVYRDASSWEMKPPYRYGNHTWTPSPGSMALFPAHLPHEVSVVRSDVPLVLVFALLRFVEPAQPAAGAGR